MSYSSSFHLARLPHGGVMHESPPIPNSPPSDLSVLYAWVIPTEIQLCGLCQTGYAAKHMWWVAANDSFFSRTIHQPYYIHMRVYPLVHTHTKTNTQMQPLTMLKGKECRKQWISLSFIHLNFSCFSCHPVYCFTQHEPCSKWIARSWHYHWQRQLQTFLWFICYWNFQFL